MISIRFFIVMMAGILPQLAFTPRAVAQPVSDLPRSEYYLARELLGAGAQLNALEGFQAAYNRARKVGQVRWVDSIPPLVMMGECYYLQGNIPAALEQYDAALMLALANPDWIDRLDLVVEEIPTIEMGSGMNWFRQSTPQSMLAVPEAIQLAVDPLAAQVGPQGGVVAPVSLITRLDAAEVFHTLAIALARRYELLGILAEYSPLTAPIDGLFAQQPQHSAAWVESSWRILRGLAQLPRAGIRPDAVANLRGGVLVAGRHHHYLSAIALTNLARVAAENGNFPAAIQDLQQANLLASQFEQHGVLAEATWELAQCATAARRKDLIDPLLSFANWSSKRSTISFAATLVSLAKLAAHTNELGKAEKYANQAQAVLRQREVLLPRYEAHLAFTNALIAYSTARPGIGRTALLEAIAGIQGSAQTGAVVPEVFQTQMALDLLASGDLTRQAAEAALKQLMAEPSPIAWQLQPLQTLARITTASMPALERLLELAASRQADNGEIFQLMDQLQRRRLYEALPLGGRLFSWRNALMSDPAELSPANRQFVAEASRANPRIAVSLTEMKAAAGQLQQFPMPLDDRKLSANAKKQFVQLTKAAGQFENYAAALSVMHIPMQRFIPGSNSLAGVQSELADDDLLISFAATASQLFGIAIKKDQAHVWQVKFGSDIPDTLKLLTNQIGLRRLQGKPLPLSVVSAAAPWRETALGLSKRILSDTARDWMRAADRLVIAPHSMLWYVPFELLPSEDAAGSLPLVAQHPITYIPVASSIGLAAATRKPMRQTVGVIANFFSLDRTANAAAAAEVASAIPGTATIELAQKITFPSDLWLRLRADQVWLANLAPSQGWDTVLVPLGATRQSTLGSWLEAPHRGPEQLLAPGVQTAMQTDALGNGNDVFLPVCGALLSGTKTAVISRWSVGGLSTANLLKRYLEESQTETSSQALRRATVALWAEQFLISDEPSLSPAGNEADMFCPGTHPVMWSGYMAVGDYATP